MGAPRGPIDVFGTHGKLTIPTQHLGEFSKTNWGNRVVASGGELRAVSTTSDLAKQIKRLTDSRWRRIIEAAIMAAQPTRKGGKVPSDTGDLEDLEPAGDGILIDNDSD
ncbi:hypothetical protein MVEN_02185800 [Mycena venus]|uniref:Uncharacterized protein n=1 Tax=Mycena venus TaxID=2733690 RepID=A0A8H7CI96_9AGAR|nr:hypothetical protein MVEN_02185800 [Mycena venus]